MALAAAALEIGLLVGLVGGILAGRWERERRPTTASTSATTSDSHTLATAVGTSSTRRRRVVGGTLSAGAGVTIGAALVGAGNGELEARSLSLGFSLLGSLLCICQSQRMAARVAAAAASAATSSATRVYIFPALAALGCAKLAESRSARRRGRRGARPAG